MARIVLENLCKDYHVADHKTVHAVVDASLTVDDGQVVVIIGPSGSGKSTLLRSINRLEEPTSGRIFIDDDEVTARCGYSFDSGRSGMVFNPSTSFPILPPWKNITPAPMKVRKLPRNSRDETWSCSRGLRKRNVHPWLSAASSGWRRRALAITPR